MCARKLANVGSRGFQSGCLGDGTGVTWVIFVGSSVRGVWTRPTRLDVSASIVTIDRVSVQKRASA
jgi:hypothetical protein